LKAVCSPHTREAGAEVEVVGLYDRCELVQMK